jgi:hypothetical protein
LGRDFAATWGRLFFGYLSFGEAKESISPTAKALKQKNVAIKNSYSYTVTQSVVNELRLPP